MSICVIITLCHDVKISVNIINISTEQRTNQSGGRIVEPSLPQALFLKWQQLSMKQGILTVQTDYGGLTEAVQ